MNPNSSAFRGLVLCTLLCGVALAQPAPEPGTHARTEHYVRIRIDNGAPLRIGAPVRGHTLEPLFIDNRLILPVNTSLDGEVALVVPAPRRRQLEAYAHGDFTPLRRATLRFYRAIDPSGNLIPLVAGDAQLATTTVRLQSVARRKVSFVHQLWSRGIDEAKDFGHQFTDPGRLQRAREFAYSQLPYHPQSLLSGTDFDLPILQTPDVPHAVSSPPKPSSYKLPNSAIQLHSRLVTPLDSGVAKQGDVVVARVTQPVVGSDGNLMVPQGTLIRGSVLQAKPGRKLGRSGALRFTFSEIVLPSGQTQRVAGVPRVVYSEPGRKQVLDSEGGVEPQSTRSALLPLVLGAFSTHSIASDERPKTNAAISSNGFGVIARIVAVGSGSHVFGGVIGGVATARAVYSRFIGRGRDVEFPANTPIEIELSPVQAPVLRGSVSQ